MRKLYNDKSLKIIQYITFYFIFVQARTHSIWWIGLEKVGGTWKLPDGTSATYFNWASGQPDDDGNCAYALGSGSPIGSETSTETSFKWYDTECTGSSSSGVVCKYS